MYKFKFFRNFEYFFSFKNQFKRDGREKSARVEWWVLWDREFKGVVWRAVVRGMGVGILAWE